MRKILILLIIMFSFFNKSLANNSQLAYEFQFKSLDGELIKLSDYKNKVIVVVNVASRCGFTKQYDDLQNLWTNYQDKDLIVIGIPTNDFKQEPASNADIKDFRSQMSDLFRYNFMIYYQYNFNDKFSGMIGYERIIYPNQDIYVIENPRYLISTGIQYNFWK